MKMIVHDLKTPLTSVLATLEMARDGDFGALTEPQARALSDAEGKAEDLLALIEDLLEVARIEEQTVNLQPEPIAPAALLAEIVYDWGLRFQQEGAAATVAVADDAPDFVRTRLLREFSRISSRTHSRTRRDRCDSRWRRATTRAGSSSR